MNDESNKNSDLHRQAQGTVSTPCKRQTGSLSSEGTMKELSAAFIAVALCACVFNDLVIAFAVVVGCSVLYGLVLLAYSIKRGRAK